MVYAGLILYALSFFSFWDWSYLKDLLIWVLFAGVPVCFNAVSSTIEDNYFKKMIFDNVKYTALVEFFTGTFTFNILTEFIIQPVLLFFLLLQAVADTKEEYKPIKTAMNWIIPLAGFVILGFTLKNAISSIADVNTIGVLVSFCMPIFLSLMYLPMAYLFAVYAKYEILFARLKSKEPNNIINARRRMAIIRICMLSYKKINRFTKTYLFHMYNNMTEAEFYKFIDQFKRSNAIM